MLYCTKGSLLFSVCRHPLKKCVTYLTKGNYFTCLRLFSSSLASTCLPSFAFSSKSWIMPTRRRYGAGTPGFSGRSLTDEQSRTEPWARLQTPWSGPESASGSLDCLAPILLCWTLTFSYMHYSCLWGFDSFSPLMRKWRWTVMRKHLKTGHCVNHF